MHQNLINNPQSIGILLNSLVASGTILLAITTFFTLFLNQIQEDKKTKKLLNQLNIDHLKDIQGILNSVQDLVKSKYVNGTYFEIIEGMIFDENDLQRIIGNERHSYDQKIIYDNNYKIIVKDRFYEDIKNHKITKDIPDKLEDLLKSIINNSPKYIKGLISIFREIKNMKEYEELKEKIDSKYNVPSAFPFGEDLKKKSCVLILGILLGCYEIKYIFPNYFDLVKGIDGYVNVEKIAEILKDKTKTTVNYRNEIKKKLDDLLENIKNVLDYDNLLKDECDYLKKIRDIM